MTMTVQDILGPGGLVARELPGFEQRDEQIEMALAAAKAMAEGKHLLVEAGTGVGKSFAYLVPAILQACGRGTTGATDQASSNVANNSSRRDSSIRAQGKSMRAKRALISNSRWHARLAGFRMTIDDCLNRLTTHYRPAIDTLLTHNLQTSEYVTRLAA